MASKVIKPSSVKGFLSFWYCDQRLMASKVIKQQFVRYILPLIRGDQRLMASKVIKLRRTDTGKLA